jgi:hypothetical protein
VIAAVTPGRADPPGRPLGGQGTKTGGSLTPPLNQRRALSAWGARHKAPRLLVELSACKSSVWRDLRAKTSRTPVDRPPFLTDNLAFSNRANHRGSSRPPSRPQPFTPATGDDHQGTKARSRSRYRISGRAGMSSGAMRTSNSSLRFARS